LQFAVPQLSDEALRAAYQTLYYPGNGQGKLECTPPYLFRQFFAFAGKSFGERRGKRLLDFGCGAGNLSRVAVEEGMQVTGIEADPVAREALQAACMRVHADLNSLRSSEPEARFDWIVLWNVIEHLRRPWNDLAALKEVLTPGGLLFLATPNASSLKGLLLRARWDQRSNLTHFFYFTSKSLGAVLRKAGFSEPQELHVSTNYEHHGMLRKQVQRALTSARLQGGLLFVARAADNAGPRR
jgi:2-polyprenyl-3-methyl-5-hydroxy-6-metoxy-1,4-benzoquinol methylase